MRWSLRIAQVILLLGWASALSAQTSDHSVAKDSTSFSLAVIGGWDFATYRYKDLTFPSPLGDDSDPGYQVGLSAEFALPFNNRKWSIIAQPAYQASVGSNPNRYHQSVELPLGVRYYFYLQGVDLFLNGLLVVDVPILYEATRASTTMPEAEVTTGMAICAALGGGARWKRFSLEGRYYTQRSYTNFYVAQYSKLSIILGVRLTK